MMWKRAQRLVMYGVALCVLLLYPPPCSASSYFSGCDKYSSDITAAVHRWWPDLLIPTLWEAQIYAESACNTDAVSGVGAAGLTQLMPATAQQYARRLGLDPYTSPHVAKFAIPAGAAFMADLRHQWSGRGRTPIEAHWLGAASYNRGLKNILQDQADCGNALQWDDVSRCTGEHTQETVLYVTHIRHYWGLLSGG